MPADLSCLRGGAAVVARRLASRFPRASSRRRPVWALVAVAVGAAVGGAPTAIAADARTRTEIGVPLIVYHWCGSQVTIPTQPRLGSADVRSCPYNASQQTVWYTPSALGSDSFAVRHHARSAVTGRSEFFTFTKRYTVVEVWKNPTGCAGLSGSEATDCRSYRRTLARAKQVLYRRCPEFNTRDRRYTKRVEQWYRALKRVQARGERYDGWWFAYHLTVAAAGARDHKSAVRLRKRTLALEPPESAQLLRDPNVMGGPGRGRGIDPADFGTVNATLGDLVNDPPEDHLNAIQCKRIGTVPDKPRRALRNLRPVPQAPSTGRVARLIGRPW